jgi:hypothetical protein
MVVKIDLKRWTSKGFKSEIQDHRTIGEKKNRKMENEKKIQGFSLKEYGPV